MEDSRKTVSNQTERFDRERAQKYAAKRVPGATTERRGRVPADRAGQKRPAGVGRPKQRARSEAEQDGTRRSRESAPHRARPESERAIRRSVGDEWAKQRARSEAGRDDIQRSRESEPHQASGGQMPRSRSASRGEQKASASKRANGRERISGKAASSDGGKKNGSVAIRIALAVLLIGIMLFSAYKVFSILLEYQKGQNAYAEASNAFLTEPRTISPNRHTPVPTPPTAPQQTNEAGDIIPTDTPQPTEEPTYVREDPPIGVDFVKLRGQNADCIGWMYCPDTVINYPVMQGTDNAYYLYRMMNRQSNSAGSLFMDFRNDPNLSDFNTIIYGHAMKNESMFGSLKRYADQAYYDEHPALYLLTPEVDYKLEIIAAATVSVKSDTYSFFESREELQAYLAEIVTKSTVQSDVDISKVDRIVTLSTCSKTAYDDRVVLITWPREMIGR